MSTTAAIEHDYLLVLVLLVQAIGQRCCGRLVDDPAHLQTGDLTGFLGRLALCVVEIGGYGDHRLGDRGPEVVLGRLLHLLQDHGTDLLRGVIPVANGYAGHARTAADHLVRNASDLFGVLLIGVAHETLDGEDRVHGVGDGLALGRVAHFALATVHESHNAGGCAFSLAVGDDDGLIALHDGHATIRRAQVDTDDLAHCCWLLGSERTDPGWSSSCFRFEFLPPWSTIVPCHLRLDRPAKNEQSPHERRASTDKRTDRQGQ